MTDFSSLPFAESRLQVMTISELNHQVKHLLEVSFSQVWVEGEISGFSKPWSGHWYLTLKDEHAQVRCAMFKNANSKIKWQPQNGDKVLVLAKVSLYEGRGDYQLIIESIKPSGLGELQAAYEKLKDKLAKEGLFDNAQKKSIPDSVNHIGIVTSATGAVVHDIISVVKRRCPMQKLTIIPAVVQGDEAPTQIADAINRANQSGLFDVLIVGRGGGSLEDLWAFNEEITARAIAQSSTPVISAVGHETDFTIADFVADFRAPTPTAAAEKISPDQQEWIQSLDRSQNRIVYAIKQKIENNRYQLSELGHRLKHPQQKLNEMANQLDTLKNQMQKIQQNDFKNRYRQLNELAHRVIMQKPSLLIDSYRNRLKNRIQVLESRTIYTLKEQKLKLASIVGKLDTISPLATLQRGYSILLIQNKNRVVSQVQQVTAGDQIDARLSNGKLTCQIIKVEHAPK